MDTDKDLEVLLGLATYTTTSVEDARILADASAAQQRRCESNSTDTAPTSVRFSIFRSRKLAILALPPAAVAATILIALFAWTSSPDITWAQVVETIRMKPWMHFVNKGGPDRPASETWYSQEHGILASKSRDVLIFYDRINNIKETCDPRPRLVRKRIDRYSSISPGDAQNFIMGALFDAAMSGDTETPIVVVEGAQFVPQGESKTRRDGQTFLEYRFDLELAKPDPMTKPQRITIEVDPKTRLPQRMTVWTRDNGPWFTRADVTIDYPPDGPKDIYELGAPRDYEIKLHE